MANKINILEKIDWDVLNTYIDSGKIRINKHSDYDIWILNYAQIVQFANEWDDYTLSCRGLVIDVDGNILARPFQKFKNIEEHDLSEFDLTQEYEIFEKMDGSLIILFYYDEGDEWIFASRGSFISEQAVKAKNIFLRTQLKPFQSSFNFLNKLKTYLFEIIYPENRIVVDYHDTEDLILLGVVDIKSGEELPYDLMGSEYHDKFTLVKRYSAPENIKSLVELKDIELDNKEGFVIRFRNGFRVKIKFSEYVRIHKIVTNVSNLDIWNLLRENKTLDEFVEDVPDEFYDWVIKTSTDLKENFEGIEYLALKEFYEIFHIQEFTNRKEFAFKISNYKYKSILFNLYSKKRYDHIIWNLIRPVHTTPFSNGGDYESTKK